MSDSMLCDTCVLIDFLKGRDQQLANFYQQSVLLFINPVIELELLQGARNKAELQQLEKKLQMFRLLDMPQENFQLARELIKLYALSHGLRLADALIAASAMIYDLRLWTVNVNDFKYISGLVLYP